ncbi:hypothetical protein ACJJTC_015384 [Scirpophaga incertulas]
MGSVTAPVLRASGGPTRVYRRRWCLLTPGASTFSAASRQPQPRRWALQPPPQLAGYLTPSHLLGRTRVYTVIGGVTSFCSERASDGGRGHPDPCAGRSMGGDVAGMA